MVGELLFAPATAGAHGNDYYDDANAATFHGSSSNMYEPVNGSFPGGLSETGFVVGDHGDWKQTDTATDGNADFDSKPYKDGDSYKDDQPNKSSASQADEEEEEEGSIEPPEDYIPVAPGAVVDGFGEPTEEDYHMHGEIDIEPVDVHKAKSEKYKLDKELLLADGWEVSKKGSDGGGISIGAAVQTKARPYREGIVVNQTEDVEGRKHWLVNFGNAQDEMEPEPMRAQRLKLVQQSEAQEYVWTLVEDSDEIAPDEYTDIGLIGFDFPEAFKPPVGAYTYPHLKLLQKLWPGDWKQQLKQLNTKIAADNAIGRFKQRVNQVS
jgi:hypothetical protein